MKTPLHPRARSCATSMPIRACSSSAPRADTGTSRSGPCLILLHLIYSCHQSLLFSAVELEVRLAGGESSALAGDSCAGRWWPLSGSWRAMARRKFAAMVCRRHRGHPDSRGEVDGRVAFFKPLSAAIAIGSGGPFGAEGPIIMTAGSVGSLFAQMFHLSDAERSTLLVAGAAAGMAGVFSTPLAAILLAVSCCSSNGGRARWFPLRWRRPQRERCAASCSDPVLSFPCRPFAGVSPRAPLWRPWRWVWLQARSRSAQPRGLCQRRPL